ncbi:Lysine-specific demethylase 5B [Dorcoceras hygrometricum]|uniref:Lysine-specific demethylase 5B n=1 Tax=Dorcoceras hygrometricum TaxID=472368 RepID=A0A2Z7BYV2_9LAMI|nr:Lysine-specific demethylase 5B [Dorcoceras hygrometricum]
MTCGARPHAAPHGSAHIALPNVRRKTARCCPSAAAWCAKDGAQQHCHARGQWPLAGRLAQQVRRPSRAHMRAGKGGGAAMRGGAVAGIFCAGRDLLRSFEESDLGKSELEDARASGDTALSSPCWDMLATMRRVVNYHSSWARQGQVELFDASGYPAGRGADPARGAPGGG